MSALADAAAEAGSADTCPCGIRADERFRSDGQAHAHKPGCGYEAALLRLSLERLAAATPGTVLYQPKFDFPEGLCKSGIAHRASVGPGSGVIAVARMQPDYLVVCPPSAADSRATLVVVDAKASSSVKPAFCHQVAFYVLALAEICLSHAPRVRVSARGGVWLPGREQPTLFDVTERLAVLRHLLYEALPAQLTAAAYDAAIGGRVAAPPSSCASPLAPWRLAPACVGCEFRPSCASDAAARRSLVDLPGVTGAASASLRSLPRAVAAPDASAGVADLEDSAEALAMWLTPGDDLARRLSLLPPHGAHALALASAMGVPHHHGASVAGQQPQLGLDGRAKHLVAALLTESAPPIYCASPKLAAALSGRPVARLGAVSSSLPGEGALTDLEPSNATRLPCSSITHPSLRRPLVRVAHHPARAVHLRSIRIRHCGGVDARGRGRRGGRARAAGLHRPPRAARRLPGLRGAAAFARPRGRCAAR